MGDKIACVVLNYNDADETKNYVKFVKGMNIYNHIIVVDNCSIDDSYDCLSTLIDSTVMVYQTPRNGGYGYGNNYGIKIAADLGDKYVAISNPDVRYHGECVQNIIDFMNKSNAAVCAPCQYNGYSRKMIRDYAWKIPNYKKYVFAALHIFNKYRKNDYILDAPYIEVECVPGAFLVADIYKILKVDGYDENVFLYCEESMLGARLKKNGYRTYLAVGEKYYHYESTSIKKSIESVYKRQQMIYKSRLFYLKEYLKVSGFKILIAKVIYKMALFETQLGVLIKKR